MHSIIFYKTPSGQCPVKEFLTNLPDKERQKIAWVLGNAIRLLGFLHKGNLVILTNGFMKKSQKTPAQEIAVAEQRKKDYEKRNENG